MLIVLTGKWTVSSAEMFVDQAHNVENVLFIGENTFGAQVTSAETNLQLPSILAQPCCCGKNRYGSTMA